MHDALELLLHFVAGRMVVVGPPTRMMMFFISFQHALIISSCWRRRLSKYVVEANHPSSTQTWFFSTYMSVLFPD